MWLLLLWVASRLQWEVKEGLVDGLFVGDSAHEYLVGGREEFQKKLWLERWFSWCRDGCDDSGVISSCVGIVESSGGDGGGDVPRLLFPKPEVEGVVVGDNEWEVEVGEVVGVSLLAAINKEPK